jgi:hypothetical protein
MFAVECSVGSGTEAVKGIVHKSEPGIGFSCSKYLKAAEQPPFFYRQYNRNAYGENLKELANDFHMMYN